MTQHDGKQQQDEQHKGEQGAEQRTLDTVRREGLDQLDGGQGWRPPAEGGTESTAETAKGGDQVQPAGEQDTRGTGIYDSGQGSRPSAEGL